MEKPDGEVDLNFFGHANISGYTQDVLQKTMAAIKSANSLPAGENYEYYNSFPGFSKCMDAKGTTIIQLMQSILKQHGVKINFRSKDLEQIFDELVDVNDTILERVGTNLDEASGVKKKGEPKLVSAYTDCQSTIRTSWNRQVHSDGASKKVVRLLAAHNVTRPQLKFKQTVDNTNNPFVPIITEKPNSIKPLAILVEKTESGEMYSHPYQCELDHFKPSETILNLVEPQAAKPLDEVPLVFVQNIKDLEVLCDSLRKQSEFAVDLEHHSYRSFQGITCLLQISTRESDYIIDTLELRSELWALNETFTDPKIVKVFHGADKDVDWLQRDFGIYVVNMFDTGQASRLLNFAHYSLAFLLKHYCNINADKQFQLADWRIRPLPEEMIKYAREDTHYLLYIYDCMKNELIQKGNENKNILCAVFHQSKLLCEKRYQKDVLHEERYLDLYRKSRKIFNSRQIHALKKLYRWRDSIARIQDESTGYVLPNHMLLQLSEILPREMQGILACCNPVPPLVRQNLNELHSIIFKAREQSLIKTEVLDLRVQLAATQHVVDLDNVLHCPHDAGNFGEDDDDDDCRPPLIVEDEITRTTCGDLTTSTTYPTKLKPNLTLGLAIKQAISLKVDTVMVQVKLVVDSYLSPYQRYILVKPPIIAKTVVASDESNHIDRVIQHVEDLMEVGSGPSNTGEPQTEDTAPTPSSSSSKKPVKGKKRKQNEPIRNPNVGPKTKKKKVKKNTKVNVEEIKPYDYSKVNIDVFKGGSKNSKDDFNPNKRSVKHGKKAKRKFARKNQQQKSMTYSTPHRKNPQEQWPKK